MANCVGAVVFRVSQGELRGGILYSTVVPSVEISFAT